MRLMVINKNFPVASLTYPLYENKQDWVFLLHNTTSTTRLITNKLILLTLPFPARINKLEMIGCPRPPIPLFGEVEIKGDPRPPIYLSGEVEIKGDPRPPIYLSGEVEIKGDPRPPIHLSGEVEEVHFA